MVKHIELVDPVSYFR